MDGVDYIIYIVLTFHCNINIATTTTTTTTAVLKTKSDVPSRDYATYSEYYTLVCDDESLMKALSIVVLILLLYSY